MTPERTVTLNRHKVEEFCWAGKMVVYVNNRLVAMPFDKAVSMARRSEESNDAIDELEDIFARTEQET
jgi:hypothetical protein